MGKILSFLPVDGLNNLFHICLGESVISIGWLLLFWNFLFNSQSCSGAVVLQLPRNFVDFFFFQKAVLSWPLVMGAFPIFETSKRRSLYTVEGNYAWMVMVKKVWKSLASHHILSRQWRKWRSENQVRLSHYWSPCVRVMMSIFTP